MSKPRTKYTCTFQKDGQVPRTVCYYKAEGLFFINEKFINPLWIREFMEISHTLKDPCKVVFKKVENYFINNGYKKIGRWEKTMEKKA